MNIELKKWDKLIGPTGLFVYGTKARRQAIKSALETFARNPVNEVSRKLVELKGLVNQTHIDWSHGLFKDQNFAKLVILAYDQGVIQKKTLATLLSRDSAIKTPNNALHDVAEVLLFDEEGNVLEGSKQLLQEMIPLTPEEIERLIEIVREMPKTEQRLFLYERIPSVKEVMLFDATGNGIESSQELFYEMTRLSEDQLAALTPIVQAMPKSKESVLFYEKAPYLQEVRLLNDRNQAVEGSEELFQEMTKLSSEQIAELLEITKKMRSNESLLDAEGNEIEGSRELLRELSGLNSRQIRNVRDSVYLQPKPKEIGIPQKVTLLDKFGSPVVGSDEFLKEVTRLDPEQIYGLIEEIREMRSGYSLYKARTITEVLREVGEKNMSDCPFIYMRANNLDTIEILPTAGLLRAYNQVKNPNPVFTCYRAEAGSAQSQARTYADDIVKKRRDATLVIDDPQLQLGKKWLQKADRFASPGVEYTKHDACFHVPHVNLLPDKTFKYFIMLAKHIKNPKLVELFIDMDVAKGVSFWKFVLEMAIRTKADKHDIEGAFRVLFQKDPEFVREGIKELSRRALPHRDAGFELVSGVIAATWPVPKTDMTAEEETQFWKTWSDELNLQCRLRVVSPKVTQALNNKLKNLPPKALDRGGDHSLFFRKECRYNIAVRADSYGLLNSLRTCANKSHEFSRIIIMNRSF